MNISKYFILLLLFTKINCNPFNHLDIQLALLILAAGDHNGNIITDPNNPNNYLSVNIGKSNIPKKDKDGNILYQNKKKKIII